MVDQSMAGGSDALSRALTYCSMFLGSGIANTLIVQLIYDNIRFDTRTMFTNIFIFMGYAALGFVPTPKSLTGGSKKWKPASVVPYQKYLVLALFDCFASLCTTIGQIAIGSGLFQVVFSSKIIFGALLSRFVLKKPLSPKKWIAIFIIVIGLCICVYKPTNHHNNAQQQQQQNTDDSNNLKFFMGVFFVIIASFIFSASHIYTEYVIGEYSVSPFQFASNYGYYSVVCCLIYIFTVTMANREQWVVQPVTMASSDNLFTVVILFLFLMVSSVVRSSGVFTVLAEYGTVTIGVLYAIQSIIVFFSSALFLCDPTHPQRSGQCITPPKLIGSLVVIVGGLLYTITSHQQNKQYQQLQQQQQQQQPSQQTSPRLK